jgi:periplasmic copper chaperone A
MSKSFNWFAVAALLFASHAYAGEIKISDAWARATAPGQENGSVGVVITSQTDARLVAVSSPVSDSAEIHTMTMDKGVMEMRQLEFLELPANQAVKLGPGGNHLMLFGLKHALKAGDKVPLTLTVQFANNSTKKIKIKAQVRSLAASHN